MSASRRLGIAGLLLRRQPSAAGNSTETRWARVTLIVDGALRRPDRRERDRYLRQHCDGDRELRREVEELLHFEDADSGILGGPLLGRQPETAVPQMVSSTLQPGQQVGPYRVERLLGKGGMGVVALAHHPELERQVALKVLRGERVTDELLRRFDTERRVLARLDHPHIARIFDAGSADGLRYFAMEVVEGEPIDIYCDRRRLTVDRRVRLVLEVCDALAEAHRNLVVHRDLKPSNLLVTAEGEPKLLDFGIAKELDPLSDAAATRTGQQPMTPAYASPEQVRGWPVTVATDVYSLGVVLYGLLCGHPPYLLDGDHFENVRKVCEEEPPSPSSRAMLAREVWRDGTPSTIPPDAAARARGIDPRALRRRLRGDLDSIVAKALAKDPKDRYRSMEQLADDLRRHLGGLPVASRRATFGYRAAKFLRRHRLRLTAAAVLVMALAVGAGVLVESRQRVQAVEEAQRRAAEQAVAAERQAEALTAFARNLVRAADPGGDDRSLTAREILERGRQQARRSLADQPELLAHQLEALGLAYQSLGDLEVARPLLEESLQLRRRVYPGDHRLLARGINNLAAVYHLTGERRRAERLYRSALTMKQRLGQPPADLTKVESNLATLLAFRGEYAEAEALYRRVLVTRREAYVPESADIAHCLRSLGNVLFLKGDFPAAEKLLREALELRPVTAAPSNLATAAILSSLGRVLHAQGRLAEAEATLVEVLAARRQHLGDDHLHVALTRKDLATVYFDLGEQAVAEVLWERALAALRTRRDEGSWELADAASQLGARLAARGRLAEAEVCLREGYETLRRVRGEGAFYTARARLRLAQLGQLDSGFPPLKKGGLRGDFPIPASPL